MSYVAFSREELSHSLLRNGPNIFTRATLFGVCLTFCLSVASRGSVETDERIRRMELVFGFL